MEKAQSSTSETPWRNQAKVRHLMSSAPSSPSGPSAVDNVMVGVLSKIVDEPTEAGVTLPPEAELAARFEVSRLTVREAMKTMSALGVVTVQRGRGTFVNNSEQWSRAHPDVLAALARMPNGLADTSQSLIEARRLVESGIAELAAERRGPGHLDTLNDDIEAMWKAHESDDLDAWASADLAFHHTLMDAAGNPFVTMLFAPLEQLLRRDRHEPAARRSNRRRALRWHHRILDAITEADPASARRAMDGHLRDTQEILSEWRAAHSSVACKPLPNVEQGAPE